MSAKITDRTKITIRDEVFVKTDQEKLLVLNYNSDYVVTLDSQGGELWKILETKPLYSELLKKCHEIYEDFDETNVKDLNEFLLTLEGHNLISFS
jgi:hypothetical protein